MLIVAHLTAPMLSTLKIVAAGEHRVMSVPSWDALVTAVRTHPVEVVVADPCAGGTTTDQLTAAERAIEMVVSVAPVVVYTTVTPVSTRAMLAWNAYDITEFLFLGIDDAVSRFRERLEVFRAPGVEEAVVTALRDALERSGAAPTVAHALDELFRTPRRYRSGGDLAAAVSVAPQHSNRILTRAGIAQAHDVVVAARVLRAWQYAGIPGLKQQEIAARLRYRDRRALARQVRAVTGNPSLAEWREETDAAACVRCVLGYLLRGEATSAVTVPGDGEADSPQERP